MEPIKRECNLLPWQIESDVRVHIQYDEKFEFLQGLRIYPSPDTHLLLERTLSRQYRPPKNSTSIFSGGFLFLSAKPGNESRTLFQIKMASQCTSHNANVWRICWNVTGTILASSADDGQVKLWKSNYQVRTLSRFPAVSIILKFYECVFVGLEFHLIELSHVCFSAREKFALNIQISVTVFSGARTLLNQSKIYRLFLTD